MTRTGRKKDAEHYSYFMAYELHIERFPLNDEGEPTPIPLDDWKAAMSATEGVRLCSPDAATIGNPTLHHL